VLHRLRRREFLHMRLPGAPRISPTSNWDKGQRYDLKAIWDDLVRVISSVVNGITQLIGDVEAGPGDGVQTATITPRAVTYAKMQNVSASSKLLGSGASGAGSPPTEITLGTNLSITGTTINAAGGGTVTTTGSPANGNLTKFSGSTSITNGDLSG